MRQFGASGTGGLRKNNHCIKFNSFLDVAHFVSQINPLQMIKFVHDKGHVRNDGTVRHKNSGSLGVEPFSRGGFGMGFFGIPIPISRASKVPKSEIRKKTNFRIVAVSHVIP